MKWIKENWQLVLGLLFAGVCILIIANMLTSTSVKEWADKSVNKMTVGDILIIAIVHAFINRSENKETKK